MKYIYIVDETVAEILPGENSLFLGVPISERYAPSFLSKCIEVDDTIDVKVGYMKTDTGFELPPAVDPDDGVELEATDEGIPEPTLRERVNQLESNTTTLSVQLKASIESNSILEECIVEMAGIVYA